MGTIQNSGPGPRRIANSDLTADTTRSTRRTNAGAPSSVDATRTDGAATAANTRQSSAGDRVEVSAEAQMLLAKSDTPGYVVKVPTPEHLAKLKKGFIDGSLTSHGLIEFAATKMLGG